MKKILPIPFFSAILLLAPVLWLSSNQYLFSEKTAFIAAGLTLIGTCLSTLLFYKSYLFKSVILRILLTIFSVLFFLIVVGITLDSLGLLIDYNQAG